MGRIERGRIVKVVALVCLLTLLASWLHLGDPPSSLLFFSLAAGFSMSSLDDREFLFSLAGYTLLVFLCSAAGLSLLQLARLF